MKMNKAAVLVLILFALCLPLFAGGAQEEPTEATAEVEDSVFKVAFVYIGIPGDLGWTFEHDRGRLAAVDALGDKIETAYVENVPEGPRCNQGNPSVCPAGVRYDLDDIFRLHGSDI